MSAASELRTALREVREEKDARIAELELQVTRHLDTIGARDRIIVALQGQEREQDLRMAVIHEQSYLALEDLDRVATWVIQGEVPVQPENGVELDETEVATEMAEGPRLPEIRRDSLLDAIADLRIAAQKLSDLRQDSNVSAGKVRIQNIDDRVRAVLAYLTEIVEGRA